MKRKQYLLDNPEKVPYKLNHHSKQSYPEKYFREVFDNDDLLKTAISEYRVKLYSLDFAFPDIKFYIEIDGEQHYTDSRIVEHDKKRNLELEKLGWKSIRIRWSEYNKKSLDEKQEFIKYINGEVLYEETNLEITTQKNDCCIKQKKIKLKKHIMLN